MSVPPALAWCLWPHRYLHLSGLPPPPPSIHANLHFPILRKWTLLSALLMPHWDLQDPKKLPPEPHALHPPSLIDPLLPTQSVNLHTWINPCANPRKVGIFFLSAVALMTGIDIISLPGNLPGSNPGHIISDCFLLTL